MKRLMLPLCLVVLLALAAPARASAVAVAKDGDRTYTLLANGLLGSITNAGEGVVCDSAFMVCSDDGDVWAWSNSISGLKVAPGLEQSPFYYKQPGNVPVFLTRVAGVYDVAAQSPPIPVGTHVYFIILNPPTVGRNIGIHSFFDLTVGTCGMCVKRKIFSTSRDHAIVVGSFKEIYCPCNTNGTFTTVHPTVVDTIRTDTQLCHLFLTEKLSGGGPKVTVGSVPHGDVGLELATCVPSPNFTSGNAVGDRCMEIFWSWLPGGSSLAPGGRGGGFELFIADCFSCDCSRLPPGGPGCPCDDSD